MSCIYPSYIGQAYAYTHLIPWIIPIGLFAFSIKRDKSGKYGVEFIVYLYSTWLSWGALFLYIMQSAFRVMRHDPYCPDQTSLAYPSMEAFYTGSLVTYIILFTYLWNIPLAEMYWVVLFGLLALPPLILVWFTYNTVYEVLVSTLMGIAFTCVFLVAIRFFFVRYFNVLMKQRPWCWLSPVNTMTDENDDNNQ
jgi:hypothetical protein